jgi:hypothetical protein
MVFCSLDHAGKKRESECGENDLATVLNYNRKGMQNVGGKAELRGFIVVGQSSLARSCRSARSRRLSIVIFLVLWLAFSVAPLQGREHKKREEFGLVFSTEIAVPENEVLESVEAVVNDGIIQGSREYNKDKYIEHATPAASSPLFPPWKDSGKVFYKIRTKVLAPANFKEAGDEGTLAVRYVVQSRDPGKTILRIDAVFVEDFRRTVHPSDGSVESAEYKDIQDHIDVLELQKTQAVEAEKKRQKDLAGQALQRKSEQDESMALAASQGSVQALELHVQDLRRRAERVIKAAGAQLKSAPFHSASNLKSLETGAEVVIVIVTPYWYGVETEDGQHGWIHREQLEPLP